MTGRADDSPGCPVTQAGESLDESRILQTSRDVAALLARAYADMQPWSAEDIARTLRTPSSLLIASPEAVCLGRVILDEAEILALATDPAHRRRGLGAQVLVRFCDAACARGAVTAFLEVAATNSAARALYAENGFAATGLRKGYYRNPDGGRTDAVLMSRALTRGHDPDRRHSPRRDAKSS